MAGSLNRVTLIGRLTDAPVLRTLADSAVCNFSVATTRHTTDTATGKPGRGSASRWAVRPEQTGAAFGVSGRQVQRAKRVAEADPALAQQVKNGTAAPAGSPTSAASICRRAARGASGSPGPR